MARGNRRENRWPQPSVPGSEMKRRKKLFLAGRDGWRCHYCHRVLTEDTATFDHKKAKSKGGSNDVRNLVLACSDCNSSKADQSYGRFMRRG